MYNKNIQDLIFKIFLYCDIVFVLILIFILSREIFVLRPVNCESEVKLETKETFIAAYKQRFMPILSKTFEESNLVDKYVVLASLVREKLNEKWAITNSYYLNNETRQLYYFSLEFLLGKFLETSLAYTGIEHIYREGLAELGIDLNDLVECEPDAGLGNGGLGRLAACFLDSLASMGLPGNGCGIRYKYGLFKQQIVDGYQVELPDNWLRISNPWLIRKPDKAVMVRFNGYVQTEFEPSGEARFIHEGYENVLAVPYDMPFVGFENSTVNTLRLWGAEPVEDAIDFASFSRGDYVNAVAGKYSVEAISEVLYPDDSNYDNRLLRLKQQYFFVSAGLQSIIRNFKKKPGLKLGDIADYVVIQINDTHPALAVPELMRILIDDEGFGWDEAWDITTRMIAYTNHTIMPEALEKWPIEMFKTLLPRVYMIVEEINRRFCLELLEKYPYDNERIARMAIICDDVVRMANLAVVGSFSVNGVARVHTELLKSSVLKDFYEHSPDKFNNKTNGITQRRWLLKSNPKLADAISEMIGEDWKRDPQSMSLLANNKDDKAFLQTLYDIKRENKLKLAGYIKEHNGFSVDPDSIFDVQVKRFHAYKRQHLNAIHIHYLYNRLLEDSSFDMLPRTFIFSGKAAPSYYFAKSMIKYVNELAHVINNDPRVNDRLKVVFLENYSVGLAEHIFPASDVSEQISTASKEASGTSNMKFMMNGAVTVGTDDGANIEIRELVGDENFILFGISVDQVLSYYTEGGYRSVGIYENDSRVRQVIDQLGSGSVFPEAPREAFVSIVRSLLDYNDEFFVLRDFDSYVNAQQRVDTLYRDKEAWSRMMLMNIAKSGYFSSDNTINQYAKEIWKITPCNPK